MNKKYVRFILSFFVLIFVMNMIVTAKDKYEKWFKEEVNLIITEAEKKEYKKIKKDDDKEFFY